MMTDKYNEVAGRRDDSIGLMVLEIVRKLLRLEIGTPGSGARNGPSATCGVLGSTGACTGFKQSVSSSTSLRRWRHGAPRPEPVRGEACIWRGVLRRQIDSRPKE